MATAKTRRFARMAAKIIAAEQKLPRDHVWPGDDKLQWSADEIAQMNLRGGKPLQINLINR